MSIFSSIGKILGKVTNVANKALPIVGGIATGGTTGAIAALGGAAALARKKGAKALPALRRVAPGAGLVATGAAAGSALTPMVNPSTGQITYVPHKRRRRKGISAKDLQSFKRVARLVDKYSKSVHHFKNFKK